MKNWNRTAMWLYIGTVYLSLMELVVFSIVPEISIDAGNTYMNLYLGTLEIMTFFMIMNIVNGVVCLFVKPPHSVVRSLARLAFVGKLVMIPFYVLNFLFWFLVGMIFVIMPGGILVILFIVVWTYLSILPSSMDAVAAIAGLCREKKVSTAAAVIVGILQFFFVADVISYVIFYCVYRRKMDDAVILPGIRPQS